MSQEKVYAVVTLIFSTATANNYGDERRDDSLGATFSGARTILHENRRWDSTRSNVLNSLRTGLR